jgi:hypothetical protein
MRRTFNKLFKTALTFGLIREEKIAEPEEATDKPWPVTMNIRYGPSKGEHCSIFVGLGVTCCEAPESGYQFKSGVPTSTTEIEPKHPLMREIVDSYS